jgi:purine-binding chemotaxis protein CheW
MSTSTQARPARSGATRVTSSATQQFATFWLAGHLYGLEVEHVQEVLRAQSLTRVPQAPPAVAGLLNLRGQVVTAVELRERLGLAARPGTDTAILIVVRLRGEVVSLLVDSIGDVVDVAGDDFELPPDTLDGTVRELIRGAYKLDGQLLLALDVHRAVGVQGAS